MFNLNNELIEEARAVLSAHEHLCWIIGGACSGKSTISRALSERLGISIYDMDEHIYGSYMGRYTPERHPASTAWFSASNPLAWVMSLSWDEFNSLNTAANAEYLDLLADDLASTKAHQRLLIDGGITHPSVLTQVLSPERVFCVRIAPEQSARIWETAGDRSDMRDWIRALPNPEEMWRKFLFFDRMISQTIGTESRECGIHVFLRDEVTGVEELARVV
ncbi:MAG: hypothetical protein MUQ10_05205, partial [Anaerolineae bacterium]|nr:hypothetical protein [Anaerolineae bacterium]